MKVTTDDCPCFPEEMSSVEVAAEGLKWSRGVGGIGEDSTMTERLMSGNGRFLLFNIPFVYWRMCLIGLTVTGP